MLRTHTIPILTSLRGVACLLVLYKHFVDILYPKMQFYPQGYTIGALGVMLFFTISGFLMSFHYVKPVIKIPQIRYWLAYYIRRLFRIYPIYALVVVLTWVLSSKMPYFWKAPDNIEAFWNRLLLINGYIYWWTVPVEVWFYMFFPFYAIILAHIDSNKIRFSVSLLAWLSSLIFSQHFNYNIIRYGVHLNWNILISGFLPFFFAGIAAHNLYMCINGKWNNICTYVAYSSLGFLLWLLTISGYTLNESGYRPNWWSETPLFSIITAATTFIFANAKQKDSYLTSNLFIFFGNISYSLFLLHPLILLSVVRYMAVSALAKSIIAFCGAILVAAICYYCIEKPLTEFGRKLSLRVKGSL